MDLMEKSDEEIIKIASPIWSNLIKSSKHVYCKLIGTKTFVAQIELLIPIQIKQKTCLAYMQLRKAKEKNENKRLRCRYSFWRYDGGFGGPKASHKPAADFLAL